MDQRESIPAVYAVLEEEEAVAMILRDAGRWGMCGGAFLAIFVIGVAWIDVRAAGFAAVTALCGGIVGLVVALTKPGRPLRLLTYRGTYPKELLPLERRIQAVVLRLRKRWLMAAVSLPSLGIMAALSVVAGPHLPPPSLDGWFAAIFMMALGSVDVLLIAWGVQWLQVHKAFHQGAHLGATER